MSLSSLLGIVSTRFSIVPIRYGSVDIISLSAKRLIPCSMAVIVPSGISISLSIVADVPISYRFFLTGSSTSFTFCVTVPMIFVDLYIALTNFLDLSLPMVIGSTVPGNSTASLRARIGKVSGISISLRFDFPSIFIIGTILISLFSALLSLNSKSFILFLFYIF